MIRAAALDDAPAICRIARAIIDDGATYLFGDDTTDDDLVNYWFTPKGKCFVACIDDQVVGFHMVKANQVGRGAHVANGSYMVDQRLAGRGIGYALGQHSLDVARELGFKAMQYNFVIATNTAAVNLWKKLGFDIVGTLPNAYDHRTLGYVDGYVMFRTL